MLSIFSPINVDSISARKSLIKKKKIFPFVILLFYAAFLHGQYLPSAQKLQLKCILPKSISTNNDLASRIIITNTSGREQIVYRELVEGSFADMLGDNQVNFKLIVQRKISSGFTEYFNKSSYGPAPASDTVDNLKKIKLVSADSVIIPFHIDSYYRFNPGYYRLKCLYWNNIHRNKFIESQWVYFRVVDTIYVKHYF